MLDEENENPAWKGRPIFINAINMLDSRKFLLGIFSVLYVAYVSLFGQKLQDWDPSISGICYRTSGTAAPDSVHPRVDTIYLGITCTYMLIALGFAILNTSTKVMGIVMSGLRTPKIISDTALILRLLLILSAFGQYILHTYMVIRLRKANQKFLDGDSEDEWGFGQVIPLVLLFPIIRQIGLSYKGSSPLTHLVSDLSMPIY
jgi:hypothetical protein